MSKKELSILNLFNENELTEKGDGNYKTECPDCGLQGGRTQGFILFPETNTWYCHSSGKHGGILELVAIKGGFVNCVECKESGEIKVGTDVKKIEKGENIFEDIINISEFIDYFKETYPEVYEWLLHSKSKEKERLLYFNNYIYIEKVGKQFKTKVNIDAVSDYIIDKHEIKTVFGKRDVSLNVYNEGIWRETGKGKIVADIESLLDNHSKNNVVKEILDKIKRKTETSRKEFDEVPYFMCPADNGVLDLSDVDNLKFLPHSKEYNFKNKLPVKYNPKAKCPKIINFIKKTFYECDIPQVQEYGGLNLIRRYLFKKAAIISGPKDTGKSVYLNLMCNFLGDENIASLSLQEISRDKNFDVLCLKDAFANIHDDLTSADLSDSGGYKKAVGDGYNKGEEKFGDHVKFRNTAKHFFSCNEIPSVKNIDDEAYYDRWLIWMVENVVPPEKQNKKLIDELTTDEELSGLLNWFIEGYIRLIKQNGFSNLKSCEEIKELMIHNSNPLAKFTSDCLEYSAGSKITKEEMYEAYCKFCSNQKPQISPVSKIKLSNSLMRFAPFISDSKSGSERYWLNAKIRDDWDNFKNNMCKYDKKQNSNNKISYVYNKNSSQSSQENKPQLPQISTNKGSNQQKKKTKRKPKTDRQVQFWEADETKDIKCNCNKEEIKKFFKNNPEATYKEIYEKFGTGSIKFMKEVENEK